MEDEKITIENTKPYERLISETDDAWNAFNIYKTMPTKYRNVRKAAKILGKSYTIINRWAREHQWKIRAHAWQLEVDRAVLEQDLLDQRRAKLRHLQITRNMQEVAAKQIEKYEKISQKTSKPIIDFDRASRVAADAVKLERLIHGDSTEISESKTTGFRWEVLDANEIQIFKALLIKLTGNVEDNCNSNGGTY